MRGVLPAVLLFGLCGPVLAQEEQQDLEESDDLPAVQNRKYRLEKELDVGVGVLPVDAFSKGVALTGGLLWHLNNLFALEGRFSYLKPLIIKTNVRDQLEKKFGESPGKFPEIHHYTEAGLLFKPVYGKFSLLNKTLVFGELYFSLGGVFARMDGGSATDDEPQGKGPRWAFGGSPGFGFRGFLNRYTSLRFDFRYLILYSQEEIHTPLALTLSLGFTTRSDI